MIIFNPLDRTNFLITQIRICCIFFNQILNQVHVPLIDVQVYCPKRGILKLLIEDDAKSQGKATEADKESLRGCVFDIIVDLKECALLPGSEVEPP
jgi:hypothetical protein